MHLSGQFEESPAHALERWMAEYGDELLRLCFMMLSDHALAEDALQESFLKPSRPCQLKGDSSEDLADPHRRGTAATTAPQSWWKRIDWDTELASTLTQPIPILRRIIL